MFELALVQTAMREERIDGWLISDMRGNNPVFWQALGEHKHPTRKCFLFLPQRGEPSLLVSVVDQSLFHDLNLPVQGYLGWQDQQQQLRALLAGCGRVAMEYSPGAVLPIISWTDGGTIDLVRSLGVEVCTSANIF